MHSRYGSGPAGDDRDRAAAVGPLMLGTARNEQVGAPDSGGQHAADQCSRVPARLDVAVVVHNMAGTPDSAAARGLCLGQHGIDPGGRLPLQLARVCKPEFAQHARRPEVPRRYYTSAPGEFRILDYVQVRRQVGRNWIARCPSCANANRDRSGDNLAIAVEEPRKYICWAGCSKEMIREALGRPITEKRYA